jgi:hypothetical protein
VLQWIPALYSIDGNEKSDEPSTTTSSKMNFKETATLLKNFCEKRCGEQKMGTTSPSLTT